jgi:carboxylesterase type B
MIDEYHSNPQSLHGPFNLTVQDQRNAFFWIQRFISGFGGDPSNITAFGESAGSVFLAYHICGSSTKLFDRAILQSGLIFGHVPLEVKEAEYQAILKHFKIEGTTATDRLDALRKVNPMELAKFPGSHMTPYIGSIPGVKLEDSLFTRGPPTALSQIELIPSCPWLGDLIIGDNFWEGDIVYPAMRNFPQDSLISTVKALFPTPMADTLLADYEISKPLDPVRAVMQMSIFLGDLMFNSNYHLLCKALSSNANRKARKIYRYHFCLSNPIPGNTHSFVTGHHFVEILYLFLTLFDRYPTHRDEWTKRQALETASRWITFANGDPPWEEYSALDGRAGEAKIAIADDLVGWTTRTVDEDERVSRNDPWGSRRYAGWRAFEAAFEALKVDGESADIYSEKVTRARLQLMQLAFGAYRIEVNSEATDK